MCVCVALKQTSIYRSSKQTTKMSVYYMCLTVPVTVNMKVEISVQQKLGIKTKTC